MTGMKPSEKLITISGMPPHVRIHASDSRKKMGTILSQTHTRTMSLGHQMMRRRRREERRRLGEYGKLKTWGRMSIPSGWGYNRILGKEQSDLLNIPTGNTYWIDSVQNISLWGTHPYLSGLSSTTICHPEQIPKGKQWMTNRTDQY